MNSKQHRFADLVCRVQDCTKCSRMAGRTRVLGPANGPLDADVVFVAEAPGRLGAERTGVPLSGDATGRCFQHLLSAGSIERTLLFVTNAVLCNPQDTNGNNAKPSRMEIAACSDTLRAVLAIVNPIVVVSLGAVALSALSMLEPLAVSLSSDVGRPIAWNGRTLVPLYHPGPRALIRRPLRQQEIDYSLLRRTIDSAQMLP